MASGPQADPGAGGRSYEELVEAEGLPRLRMWLDRIQAEWAGRGRRGLRLLPAVSEGDDLVVLDERRPGAGAVQLPAAAPRRHLCLADFFRSRESGEPTWSASSSSRWGSRLSEATAELFAKNAYRDYLELHGLSVQLAEALAEVLAPAGPRRARPRRR